MEVNGPDIWSIFIRKPKSLIDMHVRAVEQNTILDRGLQKIIFPRKYRHRFF